jgi:hypothetical protein
VGRGTCYRKAHYSSEQIEGTLALAPSDTPSLQVFHETIYGFTASFRCRVSESQPSVFPDGFDFRAMRGFLSSVIEPPAPSVRTFLPRSSLLRFGVLSFKVTARSRFYSVPVLPGWFVKVSNSEQYSIGIQDNVPNI